MSAVSVAGIELRLNKADFSHTDFGVRVPTVTSDDINRAIEKLRKQVLNHLSLPDDINWRPSQPDEAPPLSFDDRVREFLLGHTAASMDILPDDDAAYERFLGHVKEANGVMRTKPTIIKTKGGEPIQIPAVDGERSAEDCTPRFLVKVLSANKFGALIQIPRELLNDTDVNLTSYLVMAAGRNLGIQIGSAAISGTNGFSGDLLTKAEEPGKRRYREYTTKRLMSLVYSIVPPCRSADNASCNWLMTSKDASKIALLRDKDGYKILENGRLLGKPVIEDHLMPEGTVLFGDFSQYVVRFAGGVRLERAVSTPDFPVPPGLEDELVMLRTIVRADGNLLDNKAIKKLVLAGS